MAASALRTAILAAVLAFAGICAPAAAEVLTFKADLKPAPGAPSAATGSVTAQFDTDSKKLTWSGTYKGTATYATSASFYGSTPGPRGGFVRIRDIDSPFEGTAILSQPQGEALAAGEWGIVIRTAGFPKGELIGRLSRGN
ncbi:MAG: CHRD domain-containing protein [Hyphomicrobium sp.]|jgi:hypothetical protein